MVSKTPLPSPSFTWGSIVTALVSPVVFGLIFVVGQWAIQGDTTRRNVEEIKQEKAEREKMRDAFMTSLGKQNDGQNKLVDVLSKLEGRMSVSEKQTEQITKQLDRLNDTMLRPTGATRR